MIYLELFLVFFKIGLFTIGGGYAMIPMMQTELFSRGWMDEVTFFNILGLAESSPGPLAINMATFVGYGQAGVGGAAVATFGVVLPAFLITYIIARLFVRFRASNAAQSIFWGLKPVVAALVLSAALVLLTQVLLPNVTYKSFTFDTSQFNWKALPIFAAVLVLCSVKIKKKKLHPILLILISAALGIIVYGLL